MGLDHDPGRLFVGVTQDLGAVLAQRCRQGRFVDDRVGRPLVGLGHRGTQLLLALIELFDNAGDALEIGRTSSVSKPRRTMANECRATSPVETRDGGDG